MLVIVYLLFRTVSYEDGAQKAKQEGMMFMELSAKTGDGVKELFRDIAAALPGVDRAPTVKGWCSFVHVNSHF